MTYSHEASFCGHINFQNYEKDFTFEFNNGEYKCNSIFAEIASIKVSGLRKSDPTIKTLKIDLDIKTPDETFHKIADVVAGIPIEFTEDDIEGEFCRVELEFGNAEILNTAAFKHISNTTVLPLIRLKKYYNAKYDDEIEYAAKNFETLKDQFLRNPPHEVGEESESENIKLVPKASAVLSGYARLEEEKKENCIEIDDLIKVFMHPQLRIQNEYSLLTFIKEKMKTNAKGYTLLKTIRAEYLDNDQIQELVDIIDDLDPAEIGLLWKAIKERFKAMRVKSNCERHIDSGQRDLEICGTYWDGIINYYRTRKGITEINKVIQITTNTLNTGSMYNITNASSYGLSTNDEDNSFIEFWFKDDIVVTGYSLKSDSNNFLRSWVVEGSNQKREWSLLDLHKNEELLCETKAEARFNFPNPTVYRFLRIKQIGKNHNTNNILSLLRVELFGIMKKENSDFDETYNYGERAPIRIPFRLDFYGIFSHFVKETIMNFRNIKDYIETSSYGYYVIQGSSDVKMDNAGTITFNLLHSEIKVTAFVIQAGFYDNCYPQYVKIQGSTNNGDWIDLCTLSYYDDLRHKGDQKFFPVKCDLKLKYLRIAKNRDQRDDYCGLRRIEFFGEIYEK